MVVAQWHGTDDELAELRKIVDRNCRRQDNLACDDHCAHRMLGDQTVLNNLLFARRALSARLHDEEWLEAPLKRDVWTD